MPTANPTVTEITLPNATGPEKRYFQGHIVDTENGISTALRHLPTDHNSANLPQLAHYKTHSTDERLGVWFTTTSQETVGPNPRGIKLNQDGPVYVLAHGKAALLHEPERVLQAFKDGFVCGEGKFTQEELDLMLTGHEGTFPVFTLEELIDASSDPSFLHSTPNYVVVMPFRKIQETSNGIQDITTLPRQALVVARLGGTHDANDYTDVHKERSGVTRLGNYHPFNDINPTTPLGHLLCLNINGNISTDLKRLDKTARIIAVPETTLKTSA